MEIYKNNHTTSTKCQYQAAASKPKWWDGEKWNLFIRNRQIIKNDVPIITWSPWNPVAIKKVEPYTESEIEKGDSKYSKDWRPVKYRPKIMVISKLNFLSERFLLIIEWWHHVMEIPEEIKIIVFISGIS